MKLLVTIFALLFAAVFVNGFSLEDDDSYDLDIFGLGLNFLGESFDLDDKKIECIVNGATEIVENNSDLKWWFDDIFKTVLKMGEELYTCAMKNGLKQDLCLVKLKPKLDKEIDRLINALPKEKADLWIQVKDLVFKCFP